MTENDKYDINNYQYVGKANSYNSKNCSLSLEYYQIKKRVTRTYNKTYDVSYVLIDNIDLNTEIKIYHNNEKIQFDIINIENNQIKINLNKAYTCDGFLFFVDNNKPYTISLYEDKDLKEQIISKNIEQKISIPDETWITDSTKFVTQKNMSIYTDSPFSSLIEETTTCAYKEKYVYKYDVIKEYYDNNYYTNIDGYIKDTNDYKVYYKGEPIIKTVEIIKEKIVEVPKIEYEYVEKIIEVPKIEYVYKDKIIEVPKTEYIYIETNKNNDDSSNESYCKRDDKQKIKEKIIEKYVYQIPFYMYIALGTLFILVIILIIKRKKKYVE